MSPVALGAPVRFYWLLDEDGPQCHIGLWATSPVVDIRPAVDPSILLPA